MTPLVTIWVASALGAGLFFASGFLASRSRFRNREATAEPTLELTTRAPSAEAQTLELELSRTRASYEHELALVKHALQELGAENQSTQDELARTQHALHHSEFERARIQRVNAELQAHNQALSEQLTVSQQRAPRMAELKHELATLTSALNDERRQRTRAEEQLGSFEQKLAVLTERGQQVAQLSQQVSTLKAQLAAAKAETKSTHDSARRAQDQAADSLKQALQKAQSNRTALIEQLAQAKAELAERTQEQQRIEALEQELSQAAKLAATAQAELKERTHSLAGAREELRAATGENAQLVERTRDLESQLARAQATHARLDEHQSAQYEMAASSQRERIDSLERDGRELQVRNRMLSDRVAELKRYADENTNLKQQRSLLESEVARLRELRDVSVIKPVATTNDNVEQLADRRPQAAARMGGATSTSGTTRRVEPAERTLESHLLQHLNQLVQQEPGITAVLSDDNGFPVVGVGPEGVQEGVCVLTSLAHELATRAVDFVDFERIKQMELLDQQGRALRVRFFTWQDQELALGCLGASHLQPNLDEERVVTDFPNVLLAASSA